MFLTLEMRPKFDDAPYLPFTHQMKIIPIFDQVEGKKSKPGHLNGNWTKSYLNGAVISDAMHEKIHASSIPKEKGFFCPQ